MLCKIFESRVIKALYHDTVLSIQKHTTCLLNHKLTNGLYIYIDNSETSNNYNNYNYFY